MDQLFRIQEYMLLLSKYCGNCVRESNYCFGSSCLYCETFYDDQSIHELDDIFRNRFL